MVRFYTKVFFTLLATFTGNAFQAPRTFRISKNTINRGCIRPNIMYMSTTSDVDTQEIEKMRSGEIKKELESYGISTKSFFEKSELVDALVKARSEGLKPKERSVKDDVSSNSTSGSNSDSREDRIAAELEKMKDMKATEMKKELQSLGISTASFFEKGEFAKALAEARVDGVTKQEEEKVVEVEVLPKSDPGPKKRSDQSQQQTTNPFGGMGGNPFGAGGMEDILKGMGGGMGSMGGMADMLKNMGGMGGGGSPFGGAGPGMPDMAKVQQMMQNPKIREVMAKAQSNPRIMSAMTECMSNPAAFAKYQNDPEIRDLINEIRPYI